MAKGKYKRKRLNKIRKETKLINTELSTKLVNILAAANIFTLYDLGNCSEEQLRSISGIGDKYLEIILDFRKSTRSDLK